ncbi:MAG: hypothetical protein C4293_20360 [Nitrospiraceae bacterium]
MIVGATGATTGLIAVTAVFTVEATVETAVLIVEVSKDEAAFTVELSEDETVLTVWASAEEPEVAPEDVAVARTDPEGGGIDPDKDV